MSILAFATVKELKEKLLKKEFSKKELLDYFIKRFEKYDNKLGSALEVFDQKSILQKTDQSDNGILNGIPGLIKDVICQEGRITSCASKILQNFKSTYDATAIEKLKKQGALLVGRANCDEFAMGSTNEYSAYKNAYNPWDLSRVPGGSSGGSASAVAAGLVPWSLGSETGGSVRLPAAFCNLVGIKPTYGRISRYGLIPYASSLDQIGVFTRTVYDNALVFSVIAGNDPKDSSSLNASSIDYTKSLTGKLKEGLKIGVITNAYQAENIDSEIYNAIEKSIKDFEKLGAKIKYVQLPAMEYSDATYFIISRAEAASNLARFDGVRYGYRNEQAETLNDVYKKSRHDGFGFEVRLRILVGNYVLSAGHAAQYYQNAKKVQLLLRKQYLELFNDVDILMLPIHAAPAFKIGLFGEDRLKMDLHDFFTGFINLIGAPSLAVPCGMTKNNLPIGFQLAGNHLSEELLFQTAYAYEQINPWYTMHPKEFDKD